MMTELDKTSALVKEMVDAVKIPIGYCGNIPPSIFVASYM
ncbi:hypothetical protein Cflav_PD3533 [Pedosphaera parvula Ellin514]|uniref:Uncharacterized protein n=1 Tax=Pedosphaera parvula (strain Ellin514) TaxID=320771 RepID=B9XI70_PEDPL|nr:hypothetical protein Cflav_PD3533 [Pedosphaera parvula Ellin514]